VTYTQNAPHFEAVQLGSGATAQQDFLTALGFIHGDGGWAQGSMVQALANADGSVSIASGAFPAYKIAVGDWIVSPAYWGTFAGWTGVVTPSNHYTNDQFAARYVSA
jgi:hypothetical protein